MDDTTTAFTFLLGFFLLQAAVGYFLTAACIDGLFPERDILYFPLVMLGICGVTTYFARLLMPFSIEFWPVRDLAAVLAVCAGTLLGVCAAAVARRRTLIRLADRSRTDTAELV
jgi:hypothetical protein